MNHLLRPADCTCDGYHTDSADGIDTASLRVLVTMEPCSAERRALLRIIATRGASR